MKSMITKRIEKLLHDKKTRKRYLAVFSCLAVLVVLGTVMMLRYSGIAMTRKEKVLTCSYKVHEHKKDCYIKEDGKKVLNCGYADYAVHVHNDDCYDAEGKLVCTLPEIKEHKHDASCYKEERVLTCGKEESEGHKHTDSCYKEEKGDLSCGKEEHKHTDGCYGEDGNLTCGMEEHEHSDKCYEYTKSLKCEKEENDGHKHDDSCYEKQKVLTCGQLELHTHDKKCYDKNGNLTCGLFQLESHVHSGDCFDEVEAAGNSQEDDKDAGNVAAENNDAGDADPDQAEENNDAGNDENTDTGAEIYTLHEEDEESADDADDDQAEEPKKMSRKAKANESTLKVSLQYGDQADHPDGDTYYTSQTMTGFIKLEPSNLTEDLANTTVTLTIPKKYVEEGTVKIPEFNSNSNITTYTIPAVTEDNNNYYASIDFSVYDKTQTLILPFGLSFKDNVVPDNYRLPVTATVTRKEESTTLSQSNELIYKPKYKEWGIDKFVNSNKLEAFKEDGAKVVVTAQDESGNPYLDDRTYVNFAFRVNNVQNSGSDLNDFRDASEVTLTDTLPTYEDKDGNTCTAIFDKEVNSGWMLSNDGKTVSKTYTGTDSRDVLLKICEDNPLKLRFPNLKFEGDNGILSASLDNEVDLVAEPSDPDPDETRPTANDPLKFVITTEAGTVGNLSKTATKGKIYDTDTYKTNPYPWRIRLSNNGVTPLEHISIQDRKIEENGKVVLAGLDEALKFVKLESDLNDSIPTTGRTFEDMVEKVVAYYMDGTTEDYSIVVNEAGNFTIEFDSNRVCYGYEIKFKDNFQLLTTEAVSFMAYTVYRDPKNTHVPDGKDSVRYENTARSVNIYNQAGRPVYSYLTVTHGYDMLPVTENLEIGKQTYNNSATENNKVGEYYRYWISLSGSLTEGKTYEPIYIVDLLPNEVDFTRVTHGSELFTGGGNKDFAGITTGVSATPKIEENYHNSGRTALIWELPYETLIKHLSSPDNHNNLYYVVFQFEVQIRKDARPGTVRNNIYIVGDNLDEYTGKTGGTPDIYDLNNNGRTDDMIACSSSDAVIVAGTDSYAEKFIAPAGSNNWSKQGLALKAGMDFDYRLKVINGQEIQTGLVVYDALPAIGDKGVLVSSNPRNSEYQIQLREPINPPSGYKVYYTTEEGICSNNMKDMVLQDGIWQESLTDYTKATAFKLVAEEGVKLEKDSSFEVRIPAHVPETIPSESLEILKGKTYQDQTIGTAAYLEAANNFGFTTNQAQEPKESNSVWARIPFAGFTIQKVDQDDNAKSLTGAWFLLEKKDAETFTTVTQQEVGDDGTLSFRDLTEGTYRLTEIKSPDGYYKSDIQIKVIISQNPTTMEYSVKFEDYNDPEKVFKGSGTNSKPLLIENKAGYVLPKTGGVGIALYTVGGILLAVIASFLMYMRRKRARL